MWALEPASYRPLNAPVGMPVDQVARLPFPVFLVEHSDGLVLFDAGLDPDAADDPGSVYGALAGRLDIDFRREHLIGSQLRSLGHRTADVEHVIASHLHFDHIGGMREFRHARIYVGDGELAYARAPDRFCAGWYRPAEFEAGFNWFETAGDFDLFGDGAIRILHMPGHSPGSLAMLVRLPERNLIITGDVVHTRAAYEAEAAYVGDVDTVAARRSLRKLRFIAEIEDADIWINHDPDDWTRFGGAGEKR
jgi:glyoxylase-like metal-dependent hydrolase (beta-lactamase superfamily II)